MRTEANTVFLTIIRQVIDEEIRRQGAAVVQIRLFGSRARGDYTPHSDWDLFVVVDKSLTVGDRRAAVQRIRWRLAQAGIPCDLIICSEQSLRESQHDTGRLAYYAMKEGVPL
ncbi:MAG: nucleotidyltransferase domain-containing protein [Fimbriimonadales bacterium]|nr:nucleotidyltransferase domain-containing protein [Fimbriimonadales bacterium]